MRPRLPDPVPALKATLARQIVEEMHGFHGAYGGYWIGTDFSGMSKLRNGDLRRFSLQKLVQMAAKAGFEVTISLTPHERGAGARMRGHRRLGNSG